MLSLLRLLLDVYIAYHMSRPCQHDETRLDRLNEWMGIKAEKKKGFKLDPRVSRVSRIIKGIGVVLDLHGCPGKVLPSGQ